MHNETCTAALWQPRGCCTPGVPRSDCWPEGCGAPRPARPPPTTAAPPPPPLTADRRGAPRWRCRLAEAQGHVWQPGQAAGILDPGAQPCDCTAPPSWRSSCALAPCMGHGECVVNGPSHGASGGSVSISQAIDSACSIPHPPPPFLMTHLTCHPSHHSHVSSFTWPTCRIHPH